MNINSELTSNDHVPSVDYFMKLSMASMCVGVCVSDYVLHLLTFHVVRPGGRLQRCRGTGGD